MANTNHDATVLHLPSMWVHGGAKRIRDAEMGDVTTPNAISEKIKTYSESCVPLSKRIVQMAEDFDLDGIQKLANKLDACRGYRFLDFLT